MSASLRPQFFCTRPNGTLTPLIAVDELPPHISVRGAPRALSPNDTQGMTSLGTVNPRSQPYVLEGMQPASTRASSTNANGHRSRDHDLQSSLMRIVSDESLPTNQRLAVSALLQQGVSQNWFVPNPLASNWLVPNGGGSTAAGNGGPRQGNHYNAKKEFCSYWIRHGECDYQQQGCLYKHEMPSELSTLEKLGLRDIPRWYREKYGIPSLLPNGHGHPKSHVGHGQGWKDDTSDRNAMKAVQYPARLELGGTTDGSDAEKSSKQRMAEYVSSQQHPAGIPDPSRPSYPATNSPKVSVHQKHGAKQMSSQHHPMAKRIDLMSFEPLPEYPSFEGMGGTVGASAAGNIGGLAYTGPGARDNAAIESADRAQREEFVRNLQSIMPASVAPNTEYLPSPFEGTSAQNRSKKAQKSRRLYQHRSQGTGPEVGLEDSFKSLMNHATASSSAASAISKDTAGSQLASPISRPTPAGVALEPATRGATPSLPSDSSLSSETSPCAMRSNVFKGKDAKASVPGPIGSKRSHRKKSVGSSDADYYINMGRGK